MWLKIPKFSPFWGFGWGGGGIKKIFRPFLTILKIHKWATENPKFYQNHQKSTNVGFCDNSVDRSLVFILKHIVCEIYGYATGFKEIRQFEFEKKKKCCFFFWYFSKKILNNENFILFFLNHCKIVQKKKTREKQRLL